MIHLYSPFKECCFQLLALSMSALYPNGSVPLTSPYYLERPAEEQAYTEIQKPGALVRIKAPREMGKTSLLLRIMDQAQQQSYQSVSLNLEQVDVNILGDLNRFLRWLCASVTRQLQLAPCLDDYWDEDIGSKVSCSLYFRGYLLEHIQTPLVLALDELNYLFEHPDVARDVLPLFRSWYEEAKRVPIWQKLRLVVAHSTEIYVPLQLTQSPFNVGLPIELTQFSADQARELASRYGYEWDGRGDPEILIDLTGGHPSLIHLAIYHLSQGDINFADLIKTAPTPSGIYGSHLQRHLATLQGQPDLAQALNQVMTANSPVSLDPIQAYKLSSLGLIRLAGNQATQGCQLYRQFFAPQAPHHQTGAAPKAKRRRGILLTPEGIAKLQAARNEVEWQENQGQPFTLEQLNERTGLSVDTLSKLNAQDSKVDKQTLKIYFEAFNLKLAPEDYYYPSDSSSADGSDSSSPVAVDAAKIKQEVSRITNSDSFRSIQADLDNLRQNWE